MKLFGSILIVFLLGAVACLFAVAANPDASRQAAQPPKSEPWTTAQTVEPAALARELSSSKQANSSMRGASFSLRGRSHLGSVFPRTCLHAAGLG